MKRDPLWELLRQYVRLRDAGKPCISCGRTYARMDCGHYYGRGAYPHLKYDEMNVHLQCRRCNMQGNAQGFRLGLIDRYGVAALWLLELKTRMRSKYKPDKKLMAIYFKNRIKELEGV